MFDKRKYKKPKIIKLGALKLETLGKNSFTADKNSPGNKHKKP